jgi:putative component of membrane protein insertase Oxa1/YidC/SpoIIIJ protein YidD
MSGLRLALLLAPVAACLIGAEATASEPSAHEPSSFSSASSRLHGLPFAPFDAGAARPVKRQGTTGRTRRAHPMVGAAGQIPGGGPPPPSLRTDPDLPELSTSSPNAAPGLSSNPLHLAALFYANFLTRTDGPRCQHLPTCSRFASQAVARHGLLGISMGLDRVIQPPMSSALRPLPDVEYAGAVRHFDPLENYEWWFPERFTGFPPLVEEEPLALAPDAAGDPPVSVSP